MQPDHQNTAVVDPVIVGDLRARHPETFRVLGANETYASINAHLSDIVLKRPVYKTYMLGLFLAGFGTIVLSISIVYLLAKGVGIWGINIPVGWGFDIINFVWWIGIGHAGTFISAVLLLLQQDWRTSINRFSEAMTLFAVACAGIYPALHTGRPWLDYWMIPYPNTMGLWPQFRSPLEWDVFAVSTYATTSLLFWYIGLIPDLAALRDRAVHRPLQILFAIGSLGWRGSAMHWQRYQAAYLILAGLATPLVLSVHSTVGLDFAASIIPGWHSTVFPPYFVAGAIFGGFAMVLTLGIPMRKYYRLENYITQHHLDNCGKLMIVTSSIVAYCYVLESFFPWYSGDDFEIFMDVNRRMTGPYWWSFWLLIFCNCIVPLFLWFPKVRLTGPLLWSVAMVANVGMWFERFVIIVPSLHRDYLPSSWGIFWPTFWDWAMFIGSIGFFLFLFLMFLRTLPVISIFEMRELSHQLKHGVDPHTNESEGPPEPTVW
jgi:molybdopterin-containing oxidoreductase family membrane subunit